MKYILFIFLFIFSFNTYGKGILIGDSNVKVISATTGFKNLNLKIGVNRKGINTTQLTKLLNNSKVDNSINQVFIAIGTNDSYVPTDTRALYNKVHKLYPNSKIYVIWGSRGWGNNRHKTINDEQKFYDIFSNNGFLQLKITNGYFKNEILAHTPNQSYQLSIINSIKLIE